MSFLEKIQVLAKEQEIRDQSIIKSIEKDIDAKMLEQSRVTLVHLLQKSYSPKSPIYLQALKNFRKKWFAFYGFSMRPEQEERYLEVLRSRVDDERKSH